MTGFSLSRFSICGAFLGVYFCVFVYLCWYWIFIMNIIKYSIYCEDNFCMTVLFLSHPFLSDILTLIWISSVQFIHSVVSNSLWPYGLQHARLPFPLPTLKVYSNSCPLSWWCHPAISSSVVPFSSHLQSFPASGSFKWVSFSHQVARVLAFPLQHQSFQRIFRTDFL